MKFGHCNPLAGFRRAQTEPKARPDKVLMVVDFNVDHLDALVGVPVEAGRIEPLRRRDAIGLTGVLDGRPVGCAGFFILWPGVGEAWAALGEMSPETGRACIFEIRRRLPGLMALHGLHRMQATVLADHLDGCRLAGAVGFEFEGRARKFDSIGNDYIRFARVS